MDVVNDFHYNPNPDIAQIIRTGSVRLSNIYLSSEIKLHFLRNEMISVSENIDV